MNKIKFHLLFIEQNGMSEPIRGQKKEKQSYYESNG